jgi:hypothetical protein
MFENNSGFNTNSIFLNNYSEPNQNHFIIIIDSVNSFMKVLKNCNVFYYSNYYCIYYYLHLCQYYFHQKWVIFSFYFIILNQRNSYLFVHNQKTLSSFVLNIRSYSRNNIFINFILFINIVAAIIITLIRYAVDYHNNNHYHINIFNY